MYVILNFKLEITIAKNKDKAILIPLEAVPQELGVDKFMNYIDNVGVAFIKATDIPNFGHYQVLDANLYQHISQIIQLMDYYSQKWDSVLGFSPQRKANTSSSETATGVERAVYQSSLMTEELFDTFEDFVLKELQGLLEYIKISVINGKKAINYTENSGIDLFEIEPEELTSSDLGIFLESSPRENEKLNTLRGLLGNYVQQEGSISKVIDIISSDSLIEIKNSIKQLEKEQEIKQMQIEQMKAQQQQELVELQSQRAQELELLKQEQENRKLQADLILQNNEYDRKQEIEILKTQLSLAISSNTGIDFDKVQKIINDREKINIDALLKERDLDIKKEQNKVGMKKGGKVSSASKRADGIATKGKTRGKMI